MTGRCCPAHVDGPAQPNGMAACCDPDDCGPCCPDCPTCPTTSTAPKRRIQVRLTLDADTVRDAASAVTTVAYELLAKAQDGHEDASITSGGDRSGWHLEMTCDPDQNSARYREQLTARSKTRKGTRRAS